MFNKHFAAIILVLAMLFAGLNLADGTVSSYATENTESNVEKTTIVDSGTCGTKLKWELDSEGTLTISGTGAMTNYGHNTDEDTIYIPNSKDKTDMSVIAPFYDRDDIKKVVLEQGVTSTGNYAFYKCDGITEVIFPETGFTRLGAGSFRKCTFLEEITIPDTVTYYGGHAFMDDASLKKVNIPDGIETISNNTFTGCESLTEIEIPDSVTSIAAQAFWKCYNLEKVNIPDGVTEIPKDCFNKCYALKKIEIPDGVTSIGTYAFRDCTSLTEVKLPEGITAIKAYTFYGCTNLEKVNIPDGVTELGNAAFRDCTSLKEIELPDSVTTVGTFLFKSCSSLEKANVPAGLTSVGYAMFSSCKSLKEISVPDTITKIEDSGFYECESLETLDLPKGITEIEQYAFARSGVTELDLHNISDIPYRAFFQCRDLEKLILADKITSYGGEAFRECEALEGKIALPEGVTKLASQEFYKCYKLEEITIPDSVTQVGTHAFAYCESLEKAHIPDGVTAIPRNLFYYCTSLKEVTLPKELENAAPVLSEPNVDTSEGESTEGTDYFDPDGYKSYDKAFGISVFYGCENLEKVNLPKGLTVLPYATFCKAYKLKEVEIPDTVTIFGGYCFQNCDGLRTINIPENVNSIERGAFYKASNIAELNVPEGVTKLPMNFASHCTELKKVTLPEGITEIKKSAFSNCDKLVDINLPEGLEVIGNQVFRECRSLTELKIPSTVKEIQNMALFNCHALEELVLPAGLTKLGEMSLSGLNQIKEITIPAGITELKAYVLCGNLKMEKVNILGEVTIIDERAFSECNNLTDIVLPNTLTIIGLNAFERCQKLENITLPSSLTTIANGAFTECTSLKALAIPKSTNYIGTMAIPNTTKVLCYKDSYAESYAKKNKYLYAYLDEDTTDNIVSGTIDTDDCKATWTIDRVSEKMQLNMTGYLPEYTSETLPWQDSKLYIETVEISGKAEYLDASTFNGCNNLREITIYYPKCELTGLQLNPDVTVYGFTGSTTETFAKNNDLKFVAIDESHVHAFGAGTETKAPACEKAGEMYYICNVCQFEKTEVIDPLNHQYETKFEPATVDNDGIHEVKCSRPECGNTTINKKIPRVASFEFAEYDFEYDGTVQKPFVDVIDEEGSALDDEKDYDIIWQTDCKSAGTHTIKIILKNDYAGEKILSYEIAPVKITNVKLTKEAFTYNKKIQKPKVTVNAGRKILATKAGTSNNYVSITYGKGCKNVGAYKVTVKGKGNYSGTITKTFKINPKGTTITSLKAKGTKLTVKWKKNTVQTTGYQIKYSRYPSMKLSSTKKVTSNKTTIKKNIKLKKNKKYYVQIRTYKKLNGKYYYSAWSKYKTVRSGK